MDLDMILKILAPQGAGAVIAGIIFIFYRKDMKDNRDSWQGQSAILAATLKENTAAMTLLIEVVREQARRK